METGRAGDGQSWADQEELDGLVEAHRAATRSSQKRIKKDLDLRCRDLESLKVHISHEESYLREDTPERDIQDDPLDQDAEAEMPPNAGTDDATSEGAMAPVAGSPPSEDPAMEVDEGAVGPPPTSPISRDDDDLHSSNDVAGVEVDLAHLTILPPQWTRWGGRGSLPHRGASPSGGCLILGLMTTPEWPPEKELYR